MAVVVQLHGGCHTLCAMSLRHPAFCDEDGVHSVPRRAEDNREVGAGLFGHGRVAAMQLHTAAAWHCDGERHIHIHQMSQQIGHHPGVDLAGAGKGSTWYRAGVSASRWMS